MKGFSLSWCFGALSVAADHSADPYQARHIKTIDLMPDDFDTGTESITHQVTNRQQQQVSDFDKQLDAYSKTSTGTQKRIAQRSAETSQGGSADASDRQNNRNAGTIATARRLASLVGHKDVVVTFFDYSKTV